MNGRTQEEEEEPLPNNVNGTESEDDEEHVAVPQQEGQGTGHRAPRQLQPDTAYRRCVGHDPGQVFRDGAVCRLPSVSKASRAAAAERRARRQAAALARVTAPDNVLDSELSVPQHVLRRMGRHLLGLFAVTGDCTPEFSLQDRMLVARSEQGATSVRLGEFQNPDLRDSGISTTCYMPPLNVCLW